MDPILTPIMIILGKYALDKGVELGKAVGPEAIKTAKEIYGMTLDYLRKDPKTEVVVEEYEQDPAAAEKLLEKKLAGTLEANPDLAAELKELLAKYEQQAQEHAAATGVSYQATISGTGATAQGEGAAAATATGGGIAIGSVGGDANIGDVERKKKK